MANDKTFPEVKTNPLTEAAKKRLSRSMMFVPGNTPKMINSADIHGSDSMFVSTILHKLLMAMTILM